MTNLLDHIPRTPLLDGVDDWPKSATRKQWFEITRRLVQTTIDEMDLDPAAMSEVEEAFIGAGLLCPQARKPHRHWSSF